MANIKKIEKSQIDINDMMEISQNAIFSRLNCHNIGKIIEYDSTTQTCTVQMMQIKQFANDMYEPVPITGVPLIVYGVSGGYITLPNPIGSICLLFFMDRNIDAFMETGEIYTPDTARMHDFTDCIAITTFSTLNNPIQNYDDTAISIIHNKIIDEVVYNSVIKNYADSILLQSTDGTNKAEINLGIDHSDSPNYAALTASVKNGNVTSTIQLSNKIVIKNYTGSLYGVLNSLIAAITNIRISNNRLTQESIDRLNEIAIDLGGLLGS